MNFFQKINIIWQKVSLVQRALLIAVVLTLIITAALLTRWASRPDMRMLYQNLPPEEAAKITDKISEKNVLYELRGGGTSIYVPQEKIYQLRLDMAKEGLPVDGQAGYKIFDNEKIGISPFVQNINLKRALQEELAKSIQMIEGVAHARIHIVSPEQTLFSPQGKQTSASVILRLKPGYRISASNIGAITHLVAGSVEGLKSESVTVIDSEGRLLSSHTDQTATRNANTAADFREKVEQNLASKVEDMLSTVLGPGRASVKVSATIDMTSINLVTETYDPTKKVATKEEIKSNSEVEPGKTPAKGEQPAPGGTKKDETIVTEYVVGKTIEQKADLPGKIKSLKVAAVVDLSPSITADANKPEAAAKGAKIMELADVEKLIRNALGLGTTDELTVVDAKFYHPVEQPADKETIRKFDYVAIAGQASLGITAICALLVLKIFSGARKKAAAMTAAGQLAAGEGAAGLLTGGTVENESLALRKQIAGSLQSNPDQVRQLFASWLEQKGE
jgi:flagellar M-ring protein FliF